MKQSTAKAEALAEKIAAKAADALSAIDREMAIMKWPAEFRAIMWGAVAHEARNREADCKWPASTEGAGEK